MLHFHSLKRGIGHTTFALGLVIIIFSFLVAACGADATATAGSTDGGPASPVQSKPSPVANYATSKGCPDNTIVTTPAKATITVLDSSKDTTINAHTGDVIEFRMSFGKKWSGPKESQGGLDLMGPAGSASQATGACVWDFQAKSAGTTTLTFNSQPLCKPGQICALYIIAQSFTVQVK